ncbi:hypothetical protein B0T17DRAFT_614395 [Bombardia bombarda]|uniref:Uncharacterized protein n=1 Tax=Bombardia bombarda TaxID=252184 RepID=A0AA39X727_9PEZI|nr:hypothetical protein B0T17DRAFT_614395 [Bombardia bombarda]
MNGASASGSFGFELAFHNASFVNGLPAQKIGKLEVFLEGTQTLLHNGYLLPELDSVGIMFVDKRLQMTHAVICLLFSVLVHLKCWAFTKFLHDNELKFPLLRMAWMNFPLIDKSSPRDVIAETEKTQEGLWTEFLAAFPETNTDLSFAAIMTSREAARHMWSHEVCHLYRPDKFIQVPDQELWFIGERDTAENLSRNILLWRRSPESPNLGLFIQSKFTPQEPANGTRMLRHSNCPGVLRVRYVPGDQGGPGFGDLCQVQFECSRLKASGWRLNGKDLFELDTPMSQNYILIAVVRLRKDATMPDLVRIYDIHTATSMPLAYPLCISTPFVEHSWKLGGAGYDYDLFYTFFPEIDTAHAREVYDIGDSYGSFLRTEACSRLDPDPNANKRLWLYNPPKRVTLGCFQGGTADSQCS